MSSNTDYSISSESNCSEQNGHEHYQHETSQFDHHSNLSEKNSIDIEECFPDIKEYDPIIQNLLDDLNRYSTKINQLEQSYQEKNSLFSQTLSENTVKLNKMAKKCGEFNVYISRPYYDALKKLNQLQLMCQKAALKFEKYNKFYNNAKKNVSESELLFNNYKKIDTNTAYAVEMLNTANSKFMKTKLKKESWEKRHLEIMEEIRICENTISELGKKHKSAIKKSRHYFEEAQNLDLNLQKIKQDTNDLKKNLVNCKNLYSSTLKQLENISEEIHEKRAQFQSLKREPGVGAEIDQSFLSEDFSQLNVSSSTSATTTS